jgi:hypothetical protein
MCREHGISDATLCKWQGKFNCMDVPDTRPKALENENAKLKKLSDRFRPSRASLLGPIKRIDLASVTAI